MTEPKWVEKSYALVVHEALLAEHGGGAGIRDDGLLESALARPQNLWSYGEPAPDLAGLAASYAFGLAKNLPFIDGNKRVALVISFAFLQVNGYKMTTTQVQNAVMFEEVAAGLRTEEELASWFRASSVVKEAP